MVGNAPIGEKDVAGVQGLGLTIAGEADGPLEDQLKFQALMPVQGPVAGCDVDFLIGPLGDPHGEIPLRHGDLPIINLLFRHGW